MAVNASNETMEKFLNDWPYPWWFFSTARFSPGGPAWYDGDWSMPAKLHMERSIMGIFTTTITLLIMFIVILPIIRFRLASSLTALTILGTWFTITMCMVAPDWLRGSTVIQSSMNHYSPTVYEMKVGVHIGLASFNVTLEYLSVVKSNGLTVEPAHNASALSHLLFPGQFWYNERVTTYHPEDLEHVMEYSLERGMPTPLLTVLEFLTSSTMGFEWPHQVGEAGFHCYITLVFSLLFWGFSVLLVAFIPRYSSYAFIVVGALMTATSLIYFYWAMIELVFPCIVVEDQFIQISHGPCFWSCLGVGVWCIVYGFTLAVFDLTHPDKFLTIFDVDYDHKRTLARANRLNQFERASIKNLQYLENVIGPH